MDQSPKQQVSEQLKNAKTILVTTTSNPSVDEVASVIGLTHILQAMKKHASAVISSPTPEAIEFLQPNEFVEASTDRLRDFVVSFNKEKADKLRYKVEDDLVKIFITPYKTVISKEDFQFAQGDFNVDTIVVLGATKREELDPAVLKHSRILHEAEIITINAGKDKTPALGAINWHEPEASSVSELLVSISEALGSGLLSKDSSQALLTGIVAATDMFSNPATSPKVMTMAAQLMAAGADQQLIMKKLKAGEAISQTAEALDAKKAEANPPTPAPEPEKKSENDDVMLDLGSQRQEDKQQAPASSKPEATAEPKPDPAPAQTPEKKEQPSIQLESTYDKPLPPRPTPTEDATSKAPNVNSTPKPTSPPADQKTARDSKHSLISEAPQSLDSQVLQHKQVEPSSTPEPQLPQVKSNPEAQKPTASSSPLPPPPPPAPTKAPAPKPPAPTKDAQQKPSAQPEPKPTDTGDVDAARKAVQDAIASQPSPLPTPRQDTSSQEVNQQGSGDIYIDHEGNIKNKSQ